MTVKNSNLLDALKNSWTKKSQQKKVSKKKSAKKSVNKPLIKVNAKVSEKFFSNLKNIQNA